MDDSTTRSTRARDVFEACDEDDEDDAVDDATFESRVRALMEANEA